MTVKKRGKEMLYITRHGETDWNRLKKIMGRCDEPLNDTGIMQAHIAKKEIDKLDIDLIICSPLIRARQTAEIINEGRNIEMIIDDRLIERDYGEFEGTVKNDSYKDAWDYYMNIRYEKAENIQDFFKRIYVFLDDIKKRYKNKNILLVCHGGVSMPVECYFRKEIPEGSLSGTGLALRNCEIRSYLF